MNETRHRQLFFISLSHSLIAQAQKMKREHSQSPRTNLLALILNGTCGAENNELTDYMAISFIESRHTFAV